jgi:hypothetical protein
MLFIENAAVAAMIPRIEITTSTSMMNADPDRVLAWPGRQADAAVFGWRTTGRSPPA